MAGAEVHGMIRSFVGVPLVHHVHVGKS